MIARLRNRVCIVAADRDYDANIRKSLNKLHSMSTQVSSKRRAQAVDKPVKRTRVSRACDQCRTAREKCDGAQPTCSTCSTSRRSCTYTANVKKRGIQPGYIRALELALAYLFQHDSGNETLVNEKLTQGGTSSLLLSRTSKESNKLHKRWRKARFYADIDKLLSGGEPSRHDQPDPLSQDSDEEQSDVEEPSSIASLDASSSGNMLEQTTFTQLPDVWTSKPLRAAETPSTLIPMPLDSWRLLEIYFTYSQSWLPICSKEAILRLSYSYPIGGLALSSDMPDSGSQAELWSVLAVASLHKEDISPTQHPSASSTEQLYATARSLIPEETGYFDLSHVKAILNLAIINIGRSFVDAAWLLVGCASRILEIMDQSLLAADSRYKHVLHGCFVLDSMLAMQLGHHPRLRAHEAKQSGRVDEDGLEEWQPWNGESQHSSRQQLRTPALALSSFNALSELVGLVSSDWKYNEDKTQHLEEWKRTLPSKLASVCAAKPMQSLTPPAVLLQSTYYCVAFALTSSETWLLQSMRLLERSQAQLGWGKLPPVLRCLVEFLYKRIDGVSLSQGVQNRLLSLRTAISAAWPKVSNMNTSIPRSVQSAVTGTTQIPKGNLYKPIFNTTRAAPSDFKPSVAETFPETTPIRRIDSNLDAPIPFQADAQFSVISSDLETFFDELASLDTTQNPGSQPQFMQNLGFAPDANIADLFSEYIPMSTAFMSQDSEETVNLDHYGFFDGN
jgi:hypothetical protein